jgi:transcriptional regulator with XRE-family HTH domain
MTKLELYRRLYGYSLETLAQQVGCHPDAIGRLERGRVRQPKNDLRQALASILGIPANQLTHLVFPNRVQVLDRDDPRAMCA